MSKKQWGHGYHSGAKDGEKTGIADGINHGLVNGEFAGCSMMAEKLNILCEDLRDSYKHNNPLRFWATMDLLSDVIRPHLSDPKKLWNHRGPPPETIDERVVERLYGVSHDSVAT